MTQCDQCSKVCDKHLGIARKLQTQFWGGKTGQKIEYSPNIISFFCSDQCRSDFLVSGGLAGEIQGKRIQYED